MRLNLLLVPLLALCCVTCAPESPSSTPEPSPAPAADESETLEAEEAATTADSENVDEGSAYTAEAAVESPPEEPPAINTEGMDGAAEAARESLTSAIALAQLNQTPRDVVHLSDRFGLVVRASAFLDSTATSNPFGPQSVIDGRPETAWQVEWPFEDASANGADSAPWIEFKFPVEVDLTRVEFLNGYHYPTYEYGDLFELNARAHTVIVTVDDRSNEAVFELEGERRRAEQRDISLPPGRVFRFTFTGIRPGESWNDLVISEMGLFGSELRQLDRGETIAFAGLALEESCDICTDGETLEDWSFHYRETPFDLTLVQDTDGMFVGLEGLAVGVKQPNTNTVRDAEDEVITSACAHLQSEIARRLGDPVEREGSREVQAYMPRVSTWETAEFRIVVERRARNRAASRLEGVEGLPAHPVPPSCRLRVDTLSNRPLCHADDGFAPYWATVRAGVASGEYDSFIEDIALPFRVKPCDGARIFDISSDERLRRRIGLVPDAKRDGVCSYTGGGYEVEVAGIPFVISPEQRGWRWNARAIQCDGAADEAEGSGSSAP